MRPVLRHLFILATSLLLTAPASAQFQRQFGTNLDETFNKVIKSGTNYYVLGTAEITNGQQPRATVTRLNAAGELQWTLSVNTASQWNDAVLTPTGDLLVVGRSLPDDNTSRAIMGRVTATGTFAWLRSYDQPNRDGFDRIVRNPVPQTGTHPYYVLGHQLQALPAVDDVFLMNIDENGDINWKKIYLSSADDEFTNVLLAMPNGDFILGGHRSGEGLIMRADNTGALFNGATPPQPFTYIDVASAGGAGFYAVGYDFQQEKVHLVHFDVDLLNQWEVTVNGFTAVNNVFTAAGSVFLGGRKVREACARMSIGAGGPTLTWVKTLDNGVLTQTSSHLSFLSPAQLAYVDGRTVETGGFGQNCAFMSLSDLELNTCMTEVEDGVSLTSVSTLFNGPLLPEIEFYDEPMGTSLTGAPRTWQQGNACPDPANAIIIGVKYKTCEGLPYSDQTPIAGWEIQLLNSEGIIIGEQVTGADGSYAFTDLPLGQYIIKEIAQPGWTPNVPASGQLAVTLAASEQRIVNFGNCPPPPQQVCACTAGNQPGNNLAANANFSGGNTGFSSGYTFSNSSPLQPGQYWVGPNPSQINAGFTSCGDHTTGSGNMLVVNGGASTSTPIWCQTYTVVPNSTYLFETWVASLTSASPANLMLFVNNISQNAGFFASGTSCNWEKYCVLWTSGVQTSVTLCLYDLNVANTGNDFALDDISFRRCVSPFGNISGRVYETCDALPYTDQPVLPGWTVQLLDDMGTVLAEQVTGANGEYAFADLPLGLYYCRVVNQPGWMPKVPATGQYAVNLNDSEQITVLNFGLCPMSPPCDVTINLTYVDNCGHIQLDAVASGPSGYSYQWCSGESTQMLDLMLPCGSHDFCVSVTCSDGSVASDAITVVVTDNIPPNIVCPQNVQFDCFSPTTPSATGFASATDNCNFPLVTYMDAVTGGQPCDQLIVRTWKAEDWCNNISTCVQTISVMDNVAPSINCQQDMTITALDPNCDMPVFGIHSLGATDNCGTPTVTYAINGATAASGSGDASGTTFSSGTSTVTYTATDLCNNTSSCSFDVTIDCDTCACLGFQNLEFYNFLSGPNLPALCDSTSVMLPCIGSDALYWFQWGLLCSDPLCQQSYSYSIVPAAGGPALVSGTVPLGSPPFLNFSYNQLAGPGNYQIILMGHCGTDSCTCTINFSVPTCCECGGFSGMTYRPTQGIMNLPFMCGDTMGVACDQAFQPRVNGLFQCMGSSCPSNNPIQWILTDPQGNPIQSSAGPITANPGFNFTLDPTWFNQPGTYALTMTGMCGGVACDSCVLYLESLGCQGPCCGFTDLFINEPNGTNQSITCDGPAVNIGCPPPGGNYTLTGKYGGGPTIQAIMVDACGTEANNEFMILYSGGKGFNINDLEVDLDPSGNTGGSQNNDINLGAAACGWQTGEAGMFSGCPNVIIAGPGTVIPADAYLVIQTSSAASTSNIYDFSNLCSAPQPVYVIKNACVRTAPAFTNFGAGLHTTVVSLNSACVDSATYIKNLLANSNGAYFLPPAFYGNAGCFAPSYTQFNNNLSYQINWTLIGPSGAQNSQLTGNSPYFALNLPSSYFSQGGIYTLTLDGQNGSDSCQCSLTFIVDQGCPDPCPCDLADLNNDVNQGFATAYSTYSCKVCLTPLALTDCDEVEWYVNQPFGQPVGTSIGNQTFCYNFPVGGTYTVYMSVIRRRSDGSFCESSTKSQTVTVTCLARAVCDVSAFPNPDFDEGAVEGSFLEGGMSNGWTRIWGDPHVQENDGKWKFSKRGNFTSADVVGTIEPVCLAKDTGTISLRYGIREKGIKSAIVVQFFTSDNYEFGVCESADCYEVARIELPDSDNPEEEFEVEIPYDISNWDATATCGDQPGVRVRPAIFVTSPFSDEQGPGSLTVIDLDYFCVDGSVITSQSEPELKQRLLLYPNPNTGQFTLDWQGAPWPEGRVEIAGPLGQTLRSFSVPEGAGQMEIQIADLPAGMYFVKVLSEGRVVKVMRVVKL